MLSFHPLKDSFEKLLIHLVVLLVLVLIIVFVLSHAHYSDINLAAGVKPVILRLKHGICYSGDEAISIRNE